MSGMCSRIFQWIEDDLLNFLEWILRPMPFILINVLLTLSFLVEYFVVLPYEYEQRCLCVLSVLVVIGIYFYVNVFYHLHKTYHTAAGSVPLMDNSPRCQFCRNYKPQEAHHCRLCDRCVLRMDHHCFFLSRCIGLYNHRHFVQFVGFMTCGCLYGFFAGMNTILYNLFSIAPEYHYCNVVADENIVRKGLCIDDLRILATLVIAGGQFILLIGSILGAVVFVWQAMVISNGSTIKEASRDMTKIAENYSSILSDLDAKNKHWTKFLGIDKPGRSFVRHVLLPSGHEPSYESHI